MVATGIPPSVVQNDLIRDLSAKVDSLTGTVSLNHAANLQAVKELQERLPTAVCDAVLSSCQVNGSIPISRDQVSQVGCCVFQICICQCIFVCIRVSRLHVWLCVVLSDRGYCCCTYEQSYVRNGRNGFPTRGVRHHFST